MPSRVVLIGHCGADASYLRIAVRGAAKHASVVEAHDAASLDELIAGGAELLLINRQLGYGFHTDEGADLIRQLRTRHPKLKMMLVSNYLEAQQAAVEAGALPGFGKREIGSPRVKLLLQIALPSERQ